MTPSTEARRAIEALRAGVPNEAAITALATPPSGIGARFGTALEAAGRGLLIAGGFGSGKSHLLGRLRRQALDSGFVVSQVAISKETPLFDPAKVFAAAMRGATAPGSNDDVMRVVLARLRSDADAFESLERWVSAAPAPVAPVFAAILYLLARSGSDPDLIRRLERFLAGGKLNKTPLRQALKAAGAKALFDLKYGEGAIVADLMRVTPRLMRAAGYRGWCVLIDEVELIGRYTPLQRGKAYAELARWLGHDAAEPMEGIVAAAAITDDFATGVIIAKRDNSLIETRLMAKGLAAEARRAGAGMRVIQDEAIPLPPPRDADLARDLEAVRRLYATAYDWPAPTIAVGPKEATKRMRGHVRGWITQWDMLRLYRQRVSVETDPLPIRYAEAPELEIDSAPTDADD